MRLVHFSSHLVFGFAKLLAIGSGQVAYASLVEIQVQLINEVMCWRFGRPTPIRLSNEVLALAHRINLIPEYSTQPSAQTILLVIWLILCCCFRVCATFVV